MRSDSLKTKAWGQGGKSKGKGKGKFKGKDDNVVVVHAKAVDRVQEAQENLGRHCEVRGAHNANINAIIMTSQGVYSASQDKSLKRWKPVKGADGRFELQAEITIPLPESCHSLLFSEGWLFCGLFDGSVKAFSQDGTDATMAGHRRRVTALLVHQGILISGSADREVRLWQMDAATKKFNCTHTVSESMPGAITKLVVLGGNLFVGGISGLAMCSLTSLAVTKLLPPTKAVADILEFQGHAIVAYQEGGLRVFDAEGTLKSEMKPLAAGPIQAIAGLESGPRVLVGHSRGQVSTIVLPSFDFSTQFQAVEGRKIESLMCAGHDGIFMLGTQDGTLQLWQRL
jgi:WD40 repeat protein